MSLVVTVALQNLTSSIFTRKVHIEKISTWGDSQECIGNIQYLLCFLPTETFLSTDRDQEGWHDGSTLHNSKVKHIFHNVHNFVNNLVQFYAHTVPHCEVRRLKPFVGSVYKNTNIFL